MNECCFCHLPEKLTPWFFWDTVNQIIVCEDANPRKFKYRILVIPYGKIWHREWKEYTSEEKELILDILTKVVMAHMKNGATYVKLDTEHFTIKSHGHAQACMN